MVSTHCYWQTNLNLFNAGLPRWATRDYLQTSSVTIMLGNLNWSTLDQRHIDSRQGHLLPCCYPCICILIPNRRVSKFIHPMAYKQIPTSTNYYKHSLKILPPKIINWNALPTCTVLLPTVAQLSHAVSRVVQFIPLNTRFCFYLLKLSTLFRTVQTHPTHFSYLLLQLTPFSTW